MSSFDTCSGELNKLSGAFQSCQVSWHLIKELRVRRLILVGHTSEHQGNGSKPFELQVPKILVFRLNVVIHHMLVVAIKLNLDLGFAIFKQLLTDVEHNFITGPVGNSHKVKNKVFSSIVFAGWIATFFLFRGLRLWIRLASGLLLLFAIWQPR